MQSLSLKEVKEYGQRKKVEIARRKVLYKKSEYGKNVTYEQMKKYRQSEKGKDAKKRYNARHPNQIKAEKAVSNAIRSGKLPRPDTLQCMNCFRDAKQYHHPSYAPEDRLKVFPVCVGCHIKCHKHSSKAIPPQS